MPPSRPRAGGGLSLGVLLLAVVVASLNLRPGASSVGPVLEEVRAGLGMSGATTGALTGLPGLCFGVFGALAVRFGRRVGITAGIALGLLAAAIGLVARVSSDQAWVFLLFSVVALAGMAVGNVLVPAWIKSHGHTVVLMTVYGTGLIVGGSLGSLLTSPVTEATSSWRIGLGWWGGLGVLALPAWAWLARHERRNAGEHRVTDQPPDGRLAHSPTAIALTVLFGVQSMHAYIQFGWLPQIYRDAGLAASSAGALQALLAATGIVGGLVMPSVIARGRGLRVWMVSFGGLLVMGYAGLMFAPTTLPFVWAVLLGISGFAFPTAIAMITARTRHPGVTARLSGFVQPVGYALAAVGPLLVGVLHEATGSWTPVLALLMVTAIPLTLAGLRVAAPTYVDDELAG